jgi:hypothetical protein
MANEIDIILKLVDQASPKLKVFGMSMTDFKSTIDTVSTALRLMKDVAVKTFEMSKEGAAVIQTRDSFDLLLKVIGAAPDLFDQLKAASKGTISDLDLMSSTSTLLAGAQGELATNLANATPELLEIAKAANKLNPALGDTNFMYQSLALGVKRASPLILDNLGLTIKIGQANEEYAKKIGKTVSQLTAEDQKQALLNETLRAGRVLIDQVGGSTDSATDEYARFEAELANTGDTIKSNLAPSVTTLLRAFNEQNQELKDSNTKWMTYIPLIGAAYNEIGFLTKILRGEEEALDDVSQSTDALTVNTDVAIDAHEEWKLGLYDVKAATEEYTEATQTATLALIEFGDAAIAKEAIDALNDALKEGVLTQEEYDAAWRDVMLSYGQANDASVQFTIEARTLHQQLESGKITAQEYKAALQALEKKWNVEVTATYTQVNNVINKVATLVTDPSRIGGTTTGGTGGRQHGGPVMGGQVYLVGEAGPELFVPDQGGQIIPNNQVNNYFNLTMHTNAAQERVVEDFNMMRAMAGA